MIAFDKTTCRTGLQQCWSCENVELLEDCQYEIMFSDFMASGLPVQERCEILQHLPDIMMEFIGEAVTMYWPHAGKIVPRADWLNSSWSNPALHFLMAVSMRLFNIAESQKIVVDTTGLTAIDWWICSVTYDLDIDFIIRACLILHLIFMHRSRYYQRREILWMVVN